MKLRRRDESGQIVWLVVVILLVLLIFGVIGGIYISPFIWILILVVLVVAFLSRERWYH